MLRARQRFYLDPAGIEQAHRRAADRLTRQGQLDEALAHRVAVKDWINAAQLVESQLCLLLNAEDYRGIRRLLSYFSEDFIATRPGLILMQAWVAHFGLRLPAMRAFTATIQAMLDAASQRSELEEGGAPLPGFEIIPPAIVQAQVWELDSVYYYLVNQGSLALPLARQAVEFLPKNWMFARGNAMVYLGSSMFMQGQYQQAVEMLTQEYERLPEAGTTYGARLLFSLATIHLLQGELELCRQAAEQMHRSAFASNLHLMQGWSCYLLGRVYQEWNQLERAAAYYQQVVDQRFTSNQFCALEAVAGYVFLLHTLGRGELAQQSQELLQELQSEQPAAMLPPVVALIAWLDLQGGRPRRSAPLGRVIYRPHRRAGDRLVSHPPALQGQDPDGRCRAGERRGDRSAAR